MFSFLPSDSHIHSVFDSPYYLLRFRPSPSVSVIKHFGLISKDVILTRKTLM